MHFCRTFFASGMSMAVSWYGCWLRHRSHCGWVVYSSHSAFSDTLYISHSREQRREGRVSLIKPVRTLDRRRVALLHTIPKYLLLKFGSFKGADCSVFTLRSYGCSLSFEKKEISCVKCRKKI